MAKLQSILVLLFGALASVTATKGVLTPVEVPVSVLSSLSSDLDLSSSISAVSFTNSSSSAVAGSNAVEANDQGSDSSALLGAAVAGSSRTTKKVSPSELPIFFFHGLTADAKDGLNFATKLSATGRTFTALSFCEGDRSKIALNAQVPLAIAQIRSIIAQDVETYANGYIFMGHSQGGMLGRAVIEEMDDHQVVMFISLAGVQNGVFPGPQAADVVSTLTFVHWLAPNTLPTSVLDTLSYTPEQYKGQMQFDFTHTLANVQLFSNLYSMANLWRSPDRESWLSWNSWLPVVNNINVCTDAACEQAKTRRRNNFLKLQAFHSLTSARDGAVSPWQSSHFGQYSEVSDASKILSEFEQLKVLPMEKTVEYMQDTYGLQSLHTSGRLHLHEVPDVHHNCWIRDGPYFDNPNEVCSFDLVFDTHVLPLLASTAKLGGGASCTGCQ